MGKKQSPSVAAQNQPFDSHTYAVPPPTFGIGHQGSENNYNANPASGPNAIFASNYTNQNMNNSGMMYPVYGGGGGNGNHRNNSNNSLNKRGGGSFGGGKNRRNSVKHHQNFGNNSHNGNNSTTGMFNNGGLHGSVNHRNFSGGPDHVLPSPEMMGPRMAQGFVFHSTNAYSAPQMSSTFMAGPPPQGISGNHSIAAQRHANLRQGPINTSAISFGPQIGLQMHESLAPNSMSPLSPRDKAIAEVAQQTNSRPMSATAPSFHCARPLSPSSYEQHAAYYTHFQGQIPHSYKAVSFVPEGLNAQIERNTSNLPINTLSLVESSIPDNTRTQIQDVLAHYNTVLDDANFRRGQYLDQLTKDFIYYQSKEIKHDAIMTAALNRGIALFSQAIESVDLDKRVGLESQSIVSMNEAIRYQLELAGWRRQLESTREAMDRCKEEEVAKLNQTVKTMVGFLKDAINGKLAWPPTAPQFTDTIISGDNSVPPKGLTVPDIIQGPIQIEDTQSEPPTNIAISPAPEIQLQGEVVTHSEAQPSVDKELGSDELVLEVSKKLERMQKEQNETADEDSASDRTVIVKEAPGARKRAETVKVAKKLVEEELARLALKNATPEPEQNTAVADDVASKERKVRLVFGEEHQVTVELGKKPAGETGEKVFESPTRKEKAAVTTTKDHTGLCMGSAKEKKKAKANTNEPSIPEETQTQQVITNAKDPKEDAVIDDIKPQQKKISKVPIDKPKFIQQAGIDQDTPAVLAETSTKASKRKKYKNSKRKQSSVGMSKSNSGEGSTA